MCEFQSDKYVIINLAFVEIDYTVNGIAYYYVLITRFIIFDRVVKIVHYSGLA